MPVSTVSFRGKRGRLLSKRRYLGGEGRGGGGGGGVTILCLLALRRGCDKESLSVIVLRWWVSLKRDNGPGGFDRCRGGEGDIYI